MIVSLLFSPAIIQMDSNNERVQEIKWKFEVFGGVASCCYFYFGFVTVT